MSKLNSLKYFYFISQRLIPTDSSYMSTTTHPTSQYKSDVRTLLAFVKFDLGIVSRAV